MSWRKDDRRAERGYHHGNLKEALLQVAVYAGVPAANTGFQIAAEEIEAGNRDKRKLEATVSRVSESEEAQEEHHASTSEAGPLNWIKGKLHMKKGNNKSTAT